MWLNEKKKVGQEEKVKLETFPCFLCGDMLPIKQTIKRKPYFVCDSCGLQAFVRRDKGIKRLKALCDSRNVGDRSGRKFTQVNLKLIKQMQELQAGLKDIESGIWSNLKSTSTTQK